MSKTSSRGGVNPSAIAHERRQVATCGAGRERVVSHNAGEIRSFFFLRSRPKSRLTNRTALGHRGPHDRGLFIPKRASRPRRSDAPSDTIFRTICLGHIRDAERAPVQHPRVRSRVRMRVLVGRPRVLSLEYLLDRIVYALRTGCQWSALPVQHGSHKIQPSITTFTNGRSRGCSSAPGSTWRAGTSACVRPTRVGGPATARGRWSSTRPSSRTCTDATYLSA